MTTPEPVAGQCAEEQPAFVLGLTVEVSGDVVPANPKNEEPS